jgi:hypothetical protein
MDIHIDTLTSNVKTADAGGLLSPRVMAEIVRAVLQAVEEESANTRRRSAERRVTPGVSFELEEEET